MTLMFVNLLKGDQMKTIAVIANERVYAEFLKNSLNNYFKKYVQINTYSIEDIENIDYIKEKYVIISAFTIFQKVKNKVTEHSELVIASLTLTKEGIKKLKKLPKGTKALLVNLDYRLCMLVITTLYRLGFRDLELIPYYKGMNEYDKTITIAITPDETQLVPKEIEKVINIGQRVIDLNCIIEIADKLGVKNILDNKEALHAVKEIAPSNLGIERMLGEKDNLTERINVLVRMMDQGIIIADIAGKIYLSNNKANNLLKSRSDIITGFNISEILPELNIIDTKSNYKNNNELININGNNLIVTIRPIITNNEISGRIITIDNFIDVEKRQHNIRTKIIGKGHNAVYKFNDIVGKSKIINETKNIANRMASSESSVLITGESGTGKELFAQSIHNSSTRRKYQFVAVNCSALPESLLESELYGYEEGAFSGAKKGGKIGLFELAHQGTLFLDEIGEMPLNLQSKLLRVIEEKKIMKIGGKDLIDIDVRIIAATNRNLLEMIKKTDFRNDLYYRLNVLPLRIPNLSERENDILILADYFMKDMNNKFILSKEAIDKMLNYDWPGNIRELRNVIEYLINLNKEIVNSEDIPIYNENKLSNTIKLTKVDEELINKFIINEGKNLKLYKFILTEMKKSYEKRKNIGRNKLTKIANENNLFITEQEIRNGLTKLSSYGFIVSGRGRKGSVISQIGIRAQETIIGLLGV